MLPSVKLPPAQTLQTCQGCMQHSLQTLCSQLSPTPRSACPCHPAGAPSAPVRAAEKRALLFQCQLQQGTHWIRDTLLSSVLRTLGNAMVQRASSSFRCTSSSRKNTSDWAGQGWAVHKEICMSRMCLCRQVSVPPVSSRPNDKQPSGLLRCHATLHGPAAQVASAALCRPLWPTCRTMSRVRLTTPPHSLRPSHHRS